MASLEWVAFACPCPHSSLPFHPSLPNTYMYPIPIPLSPVHPSLPNTYMYPIPIPLSPSIHPYPIPTCTLSPFLSPLPSIPTQYLHVPYPHSSLPFHPSLPNTYMYPIPIPLSPSIPIQSITTRPASVIPTDFHYTHVLVLLMCYIVCHFYLLKVFVCMLFVL